VGSYNPHNHPEVVKSPSLPWVSREEPGHLSLPAAMRQHPNTLSEAQELRKGLCVLIIVRLGVI
jgi:hypothetical protein